MIELIEKKKSIKGVIVNIRMAQIQYTTHLD